MDTDLQEKLKTLLIAKHLTIATAESLTCGHLQNALGSVSGSSAFFLGGITAYNLQQKTRLLKISAQHAEICNCVSQQVANEMAQGACRLFESDIGLGTTGYAQPCPTHNVSQPIAYFSICRRIDGKLKIVGGGQICGKHLNRIEMQKFVTETVLKAVLYHLKKISF